MPLWQRRGYIQAEMACGPLHRESFQQERAAFLCDFSTC